MNDVFIVGKVVGNLKTIRINNQLKVLGVLSVGHTRGFYQIDFEIWDYPARKFLNNFKKNDDVVIKGELKTIEFFDDNNQLIDKKTGVLAKNIKHIV